MDHLFLSFEMWVCVFLNYSFFFFFGCAHGMQKFLVWGLEPEPQQ